MATSLQVSADARPESIRPLRNLVARLASDTGFSESEAYAVKLCVSEALANAVLHAYPGREAGAVHVGVREEDDALDVTVSDDGRGVHGTRDGEHELHLGLALMSRLAERCTFTAASDGTRVDMHFSHRRRGTTQHREARRFATASGAF
jgi:serine/threonine-protein kinase RsbW